MRWPENIFFEISIKKIEKNKIKSRIRETLTLLTAADKNNDAFFLFFFFGSALIIGWSQTVHFRDLRKRYPKVQKRTPLFLNGVITDFYYEYILWPKVSKTPGSNTFDREGTFNIQHTYNIRTDIATTRLTRPRGPKQIQILIHKFIQY